MDPIEENNSQKNLGYKILLFELAQGQGLGISGMYHL